MERPTTLEVLQALGEVHAQEPVMPVEDLEDDAIEREWEQIDGVPEDRTFLGLVMTTRGLTFGRFAESLIHGGRKNHHNSNNLSGTRIAPLSLLSNLVAPHHSGSGDEHKSKHHFTRVENRVRNFLHLPRHASVAAGAVGRHELVEKATAGTEIVDQREEEVAVRSDDCVPYVVSRPIPEGKTLRKVVITVVSKDQGWSSYPDDHGTYRNSWTWFELSVGPAQDSGEKWRGELVRNLHAHGEFKEHTIEITDGGLYEKTKSGDVLTVWALSKYPRWKNTVKKATIRYVIE
jgi:hypothetical protein